jgi:voltage-gated potassium channel
LLPDLAAPYREACYTINLVVWVLFVVDYLVRLAMATDRLSFVRRSWLDLVIIAVPIVRPLRAVRGLQALRAISYGGASLTRRNVVAAVAITVAAGGAVASLSMLDAERSNPDANIKTYGDALWWALSTMTTVGYGDRYPTTAEGRLIAAALMLAGVALLGVITASLASWFVERIGQANRIEQETLLTIRVLRTDLDELRQELRAAMIASTAAERSAAADKTLSTPDTGASERTDPAGIPVPDQQPAAG